MALMGKSAYKTFKKSITKMMKQQKDLSSMLAPYSRTIPFVHDVHIGKYSQENK